VAAADAPPGGSGLPRQVLRPWQDPQPRQRDALTAERITAAGIQIAGQHGISAVTIRRLAASMGHATMAVYRHVSSRDELLLLMMDRALGSPPGLHPGEPWQAGLRRWAAGLFGRYLAHPWLLDAPVPGMPVTPHHAMWVEHALAITSHTGLTTGQRLEAALLIDGHLRTLATLARPARCASRSATGPRRPAHRRRPAALPPLQECPGNRRTARRHRPRHHLRARRHHLRPGQPR